MSFAKLESCVDFTDPSIFSYMLSVPWRGTRHSCSVHWLKTKQLFYLKFNFEKPIGLLKMGGFVGKSVTSSSCDEGIHEQNMEWSNVHFKVRHSCAPPEFLNYLHYNKFV